MINFLRRIRRELINENKTSIYLVYAVGEVVLVVFGILIALQLDNLNENRKSEASQNQLLIRIVSDLDHDINFFKEIDSIYQNDLNEIEYVIEQALSQKNSKLNSTKQMVAGRGSTLYFAVTKSTYEEMLNTGLLYQIANEDLKNDIMAYHELADFLLEKENRDNQNYNNWVLGIKNDDPKQVIMRLLEQRNLDYIDWSWLQNPHSEMYKNVETVIIWQKAAIESNLGVLKNLKIEARNLKNDIQTYLNK